MEFIQVKKYGKEKEEFIRKLNKSVGENNWFWVFRVSNKLYSNELGLQLYEDAYWQLFRNDISHVKELVEKHFNVCTFDRKDIDDGIDYHRRSQYKDYSQDIVVRRCLLRLGIWFKGEDLFKIHGTKLNDAYVPFHLPHLILNPDSTHSARSWLDSNRLIVVAKEPEDKFQLAKVLVK